MKRPFIFGLAFAVVLGLIGLFIGTNIGGNYFPNFEFFGGKGYEATGYLGALIGALLGLFLGVLLGKRNNPTKLP